ncbi:SURF1 family protein [Kineosporiaceae bacterium SCSIO 59966]|nr:SURF1 family protein [Kineosporiaceae bacterium SCSIO 59966]
MLRTATRPHFIALLGVALAAATLFAYLGDWQLGRARDEAAREVREQTAGRGVVPLEDVLAPAEPLEGSDVRQLVRVTGVLDPDAAVRVPDRELDGRPGSWLVAPLAVDRPDETDGGTLAVVLGWLPDGARPLDVPAGRVTLEGRLEQSEPPVGGAGPGTRELPTVASADLVNVWDPPLYTAYLALTDTEPPLEPVPTVEPADGLALQNLSYALQWWLFAGFAVFFWWRLVRDAHERELEARAEAAAPEQAQSTS